jgi:hypothetical protein
VHAGIVEALSDDELARWFPRRRRSRVRLIVGLAVVFGAVAVMAVAGYRWRDDRPPSRPAVAVRLSALRPLPEFTATAPGARQTGAESTDECTPFFHEPPYAARFIRFGGSSAELFDWYGARWAQAGWRLERRDDAGDDTELSYTKSVEGWEAVLYITGRRGDHDFNLVIAPAHC